MITEKTTPVHHSTAGCKPIEKCVIAFWACICYNHIISGYANTKRKENTMNIGERIKSLRKQNDLTQEKLADYLGVSYQAVSKWECGLSCPDLSLIGPLTRLLHITADELLGLTSENSDERKAYFDAELHEYWKKDDHESDLAIARMAVAEYPSDYRYLEWLATDEWYVGYSIPYCGTETEKELLASSLHHYEMILEDCPDQPLRNRAISGLVFVYTSLGQLEEAKQYALMYPENPEYSRDKLLRNCLRGEDLADQRKKLLKRALMEMNECLSDMWQYSDPTDQGALDAEEAIIKAVITDGNYQHFHINLSFIYSKRAALALEKDDLDGAISALATAKEHAVAYDALGETQRYTCPLLAGYSESYANVRETDWTLLEFLRQDVAAHPRFDPIRNHPNFQALFHA